MTSAATAAVLNINDAPTEAPTINDTTPAEDQLLTASTAGDCRHRWPGPLQLPVAGVARRHQLEPHCGGDSRHLYPRRRARGPAAAGGGELYHLGGGLLLGGQVGTLESVTSAATAAVLNINDTPTGAPAISDTTPAEDQLLTASVGTLATPMVLAPSASSGRRR